MMVGESRNSLERKTIPEEEISRSMDLKTIWDAEEAILEEKEKKKSSNSIFVLNLLNLYTLFIALFWKQQDLKKEIEQQSLISPNCTDSQDILTESILNSTVSMNCSQQSVNNSSSSVCWETMIGQEVLKLTIMDLVFVLGTILIQDFIRGLFVRYCNILCCWDLEKKFPEYGDFKTAENLLHLINNQGVIWLGTFFSPGLPVLNLLKLLILLYVRCWSVMVCNVPQEAIFRSSRSNNFYYGLLLIMLFLSMLPPLFAIVAVEPSPDCGPFSGHEKMFHILTETLEDELPPLATSILNYATSPGIIIPVFMLLG
ncbi:hypothetical protein FSP39_011380 [Pinctada imbricata]|uniref:TMC domain-containing protein n=1 Tax=Pinctada imbricata TaxID=66713 RepID=A0AA88XSL1_PINIB|nr:hypothetical protein FSP39_011380 [Pinctada imbricata]